MDSIVVNIISGSYKRITRFKLNYVKATNKSLHEQVAWGGQIVMNTQAEIAEAFEQLSNSTFIK